MSITYLNKNQPIVIRATSKVKLKLIIQMLDNHKIKRYMNTISQNNRSNCIINLTLMKATTGIKDFGSIQHRKQLDNLHSI
jgi:hypothetical protein